MKVTTPDKRGRNNETQTQRERNNLCEEGASPEKVLIHQCLEVDGLEFLLGVVDGRLVVIPDVLMCKIANIPGVLDAPLYFIETSF